MTLEHARTDIVFFQQCIIGVEFLYAFSTESDIEHLQTTDILLIFREEE